MDDAQGTLFSQSQSARLLLIFLRHLGCTFCKEALADLGRLQAAIAAAGARIVLVHMGEPALIRVLLAKYRLPSNTLTVSNPSREVYTAFGLKRGTPAELFGPEVIARGLQSTVSGHIQLTVKGDPFQMPGAFVIHKGEVVIEHPFRHAGVRPDYLALARGEKPAG